MLQISTKKIGKLDEVDSISIKGEGSFLIKSSSKKDINEAVFTCCVKNKWILLEMTSNTTRLEDVFRDLTINR